MKPAIEICQISKLYHFRGRKQQATSIKEAVSNAFLAPWHRFRELAARGSFTEQAGSDAFWALDDINFNVDRGEVVGVVGTNGSGKSTLLKILSRVTAPTKGKALVRGRCASLLEIGTGFHGELSGRDNVYLNGAVLGMSRDEVKRNFDAIVDFSDCGKFIDTPVKYYSSGMYVRLAFAIAAHLRTDILFLDEILAVGDPAFKKKCLSQIKENKDRAVIFISHDNTAVRSICSRVVHINHGKVLMDAPVEEGMARYSRFLSNDVGATTVSLKDRKPIGTGGVRITSVSARDDEGNENWRYLSGEQCTLKVGYLAQKDIGSLKIIVQFFAADDMRLLSTISKVASFKAIKEGHEGSIEVLIKNLILNTGDYRLRISIVSKDDLLFDRIFEDNLIPLLSVDPHDDRENPPGYFNIEAELKAS